MAGHPTVGGNEAEQEQGSGQSAGTTAGVPWKGLCGQHLERVGEVQANQKVGAPNKPKTNQVSHLNVSEQVGGAVSLPFPSAHITFHSERHLPRRTDSD